jgi:hypothetical protein
MTHLSQLRWILLPLLFVFAIPFSMIAADSPPTLTVGDGGATLYAQQDVETKPMGTLQKDEILFPIAQAVGSESWYMVRTKQGVVGWVRAAEVAASTQIRETFMEKDSASSTWTAITADGRTFSGSWSASPSSAGKAANGAWSLRDSSGGSVMRGTWSAEMHTTGWNGTWRAAADGRKSEYRGSWSVDAENPKAVRFSELFEAAAREATRGIWTAGNESGSWSIRVVK